MCRCLFLAGANETLAQNFDRKALEVQQALHCALYAKYVSYIACTSEIYSDHAKATERDSSTQIQKLSRYAVGDDNACIAMQKTSNSSS